MTLQTIEDTLTKQVAGITVKNVSIEYPDKTAVLEIEGENDYYIIENDGVFSFTDGTKKEKITSRPETGPELDEHTFLEHVIKQIISEE
jgi:hypothetical protein